MKKCIIITTINKPTETIFRHINNNKDYDLIIVGDKKTPDDYYSLDCTYLDIKKQHELFPWTHPCSKIVILFWIFLKNLENDTKNIYYNSVSNPVESRNTKTIRAIHIRAK